ncbi:MAG TPA: PDZ domain-containing protein [Planctomycetota bacterium]|nr:PDZ domain-containing protein [Planctomycetota bacterium]
MRFSSYCRSLFAAALLLPGAVSAAEGGAYLGVFMGPIPEVLQAQIGEKEGVILEKVVSGSPAERAGLRRHDVIIAIGGEKVAGPEDLIDRVGAAKPGDVLKLDVRRGKETLHLEATVAARPAPVENDGEEAVPAEKEPEHTRGFLGIGSAEVPEILAVHLGISDGTGVVAGDVLKGSPAEKAGVERNDVIVGVDGYEVKGAEDFSRLIAEKRPGDKVKIELIHKGDRKSVEAVLGKRPAGVPGLEGRDAFHPFRLDRDPFKGSFRFGGPGSSRSGRVIIESPDGNKNHVFELPRGTWEAGEDLAEAMRELRLQLKGLEHLVNPDDLSQRLKGLVEDLDRPTSPGSKSWSSSESRSVVRMVEGGYDITLEDVNGNRTVNVKKDGKVLFENVPFEKLDTLPSDVRERVEKVSESLVPATRPAQKGRPVPAEPSGLKA